MTVGSSLVTGPRSSADLRRSTSGGAHEASRAPGRPGESSMSPDGTGTPGPPRSRTRSRHRLHVPAGTSPRPRRDPCWARTGPRTGRHRVESGPYMQRRLRTAPQKAPTGHRRSTGSGPARRCARPLILPAGSLEPPPPICRPHRERRATGPWRWPPRGSRAADGPACGWESTRRSGRPAALHRCRQFVRLRQRVVGRAVVDHDDFKQPVGLERTVDRGFQGCHRVVRRDDDAEIACDHALGPSIAGSSASGMASKSGPTSNPKTGSCLRMAAMVPSELCRAPGS